MKRSVLLNRECGAKRARVRGAINDELALRGYNQSTFALKLGVSQQAVNKTINGAGNSPDVLDGLRAEGISEKLLFDPRRKRAQAENRKERAVA